LFSVQEYCDGIEYGSDWGGQPEIVAIANALKVAITVISAEGLPFLTRADSLVRLLPALYPKANIDSIVLIFALLQFTHDRPTTRVCFFF
jgi:hypothetical protein